MRNDVLTEIVDYASNSNPPTAEALVAARLSLMDSLGCAIAGSTETSCARHIRSVLGDDRWSLDSALLEVIPKLHMCEAAYAMGTAVRWLDFNDTWLAAEWGHPSDNLGAILAAGCDRTRRDDSSPFVMADVFRAMVKAYEIQGVLAMSNSLNRFGLDHVVFVKIASAAVAAAMLGGSKDAILNAITNALVDGGPLRIYRHRGNAGPRKSWAAGDATSRGMWHALLALNGEPGYPSVLKDPTWGFEHVLHGDIPLELSRPLGSEVIEHVLYKVQYPAEFHAQTALEAAIQLHPLVEHRLSDVARVEIETQEAGARIIDRHGPLSGPSDRDHCLQYIVALGLIKGDLVSDDYGDQAAGNPQIDALRAVTVVAENESFTREYSNAAIRAVPNSVRVIFHDGSATPAVAVRFPLGHPRRRQEALPWLVKKFEVNVARVLSPSQSARLVAALSSTDAKIDGVEVDRFLTAGEVIAAGVT